MEMGKTTPFSVQIDHIGTTDIVTVRGEVDIVSAPQFEEKLSTATADRPSLSTFDISTSWIPPGLPSWSAADKS